MASRSTRRSTRRNDPLAALLVALAVAVLVLGARWLGLAQRLELSAFDHFSRLVAPAREEDPWVRMVEVTESDIQKLGTWPVPDAVLAQVTRAVSEAGARAIGIDIYRDLPVAPGSDELDAVLRTTPRAVFVSKFADPGAEGVAPPAVLKGTAQIGFNNVVLDPDGLVRRTVLFMADEDGATGYAFPLRLALLQLANDGIFAQADPERPELLRLGPSTLLPVEPGTGGYADADTGGYQMLLDFRGSASRFPSVTLSDILEHGADPAFFGDRIAIVGVTAESLPDRFHVAVTPAALHGLGISGAALHGHMASQLVRYGTGELAPLATLAGWQEAALVVVLALAGALVRLAFSATWAFAAVGGAGLLGLWAVGWGGLAQGFWLPVAPAGVAFATSLSVFTAYVSSRERAQRAELMQLFSRHVTKELAEEVWRQRDDFVEGGRPRRERLTATILFIDMKGYTASAEKMEPEDLMDWLDEFLCEMSQKALDRGGLIEDYFGDGMMAGFGIPIARSDPEAIRRDAQNAVQAALDMERALAELNAKWKGQGLPPIGIRAGICTGVLVAGSMGSANRMKYALVGDAVVTAQRLESMDHADHDFEQEPCRILISETTYQHVASDVVTEKAGTVALKGKSEPVTVYRVLGPSSTPDL